MNTPYCEEVIPHRKYYTHRNDLPEGFTVPAGLIATYDLQSQYTESVGQETPVVYYSFMLSSLLKEERDCLFFVQPS